MGEKEVICQHKETITKNRGVCGVCGQIRLYDSESPYDSPTIIKRGRINGVLTKVLPGNKFVEMESTEPEKLAQRTPANYKELSNLEKHKWIVGHKKSIIADLEAIGQQATADKWHIPKGTLGVLAVQWGVKCKGIKRERRPAKKAEMPPAQGPATSDELPSFPALNESWTEAVKVAWFEAYTHISCKEPLSDKHITPKARNVLDKCLAHSLELFTKDYHDSESFDDDKCDAYLMTQCDFCAPSELANQMSSWARQLATVGDDAFVRGGIYALNKTRDYFSSIQELDPEPNV